jgi:pimeloyl-ACP methyl ester carboxylesterase
MEWLGTTLDSLGVERTGLVGHSYGAWIALQFALHAPRRISGLALLDPTKCFTGQSTLYALRGIRAVFGTTQAMRRFLAWEASGRTIDPGWLDVMARRPGGRTSLVWPMRPNRAALRALPTRTLVLLAERTRHHDIIAAAKGARLLPDVEIVVIPGATHHTMPTEDADAINAELTRFFTSA